MRWYLISTLGIVVCAVMMFGFYVPAVVMDEAGEVRWPAAMACFSPFGLIPALLARVSKGARKG